MPKTLNLVKDDAYLWYDVTPTCEVLKQDIPYYAFPIKLSDEDAERYERFLEESRYWHERFDRETNNDLR